MERSNHQPAKPSTGPFPTRHRPPPAADAFLSRDPIHGLKSEPLILMYAASHIGYTFGLYEGLFLHGAY
ncbi:hypothetical protein ZWY2020_017358 [Hordeum vulgare]|nr:hypothetical protein ZWY2020_017358 [Hordeum vulgare]